MCAEPCEHKGLCPPFFAAGSGCMCMNRLREPVRVESGTLVCAAELRCSACASVRVRLDRRVVG